MAATEPKRGRMAGIWLPQHQQRRKNPLVAALLQGIPLLAVGGCFGTRASDQNSDVIGLALLLSLSALFWGFGYRYVGRAIRFGVVALAGPVLAFASCTANYSDVPVDFEGPGFFLNSSKANDAAAWTGLIISGVVVLLAVDAALLAVLHNEKLKRIRDDS